MTRRAGARPGHSGGAACPSMRRALFRDCRYLSGGEPITAQSVGAGKDELAAIPLALGIVVEEVAVQPRLDHAAGPPDPIHVVLSEIAVDPIQDIEGSVRAHATDEVRRQVLNLLSLLHEDQLRKDRHALQPDGHRPQHVRNRVLLGEDDPKDGARPQQVQLVRERVIRALVRLADRRLEAHHVDKIDGARDKDDLHGRVVQGDVAPEQIEVAEAEHHGIHLLHSARHADATLALLQLEDEQHYAH
mmetsp:Transcript_79962/g.232157  ORF Transcript_79962/g.232157 Transcript_79962/m.232157 type:complete len:246 (+) Transcript_79962:3-740(+)